MTQEQITQIKELTQEAFCFINSFELPTDDDYAEFQAYLDEIAELLPNG